MTRFDTIFDLLSAASEAHGERTAIEFAGESLTYQALCDRAERLATMLRNVGAAPGMRVAHSFSKSIDAIVALFAIARTGAAYVPLDPAWPVERVRQICDDADIRIWTGTNAPPAELANTISAIFVTNARDSAATAIAACASAPRITGAVPAPDRGIANLLFTSGSTGRPKGVEITTASLLHFADWGARYFALSPQDRVANHAPYNFDLSTFDIFASIRAGATMLPVPERVKMFPYQLAKFIADRRITVWYSVPSALVMLQLRGDLPAHDLSVLRHVIFAGEVMPKPAIRELHGLLPHVALTNLYGPTETNACTFHRVTSDDLDDDGPLPIGRALEATRLWIVDEDLRETPTGASGELLVAGPLITTGYANDAALTAQRLVPAPDGDGKAYRTGDRVRRRGDGALMFEGRTDRMIKCRGHRIEPGEIEAALAMHGAVREAAVVGVKDDVFGQRLRAVLTLREGAAADEAVLRAHCRGALPAYMVPDEWVIRDALPRTDRGKVDLRALAAAE